MMIKVISAPDRRPEIISLAEVFEAQGGRRRPGGDHVLLRLRSPDRLQALEELLAPYGIRELVRTGRIALDRDGELGHATRMRVVA